MSGAPLHNDQPERDRSGEMWSGIWITFQYASYENCWDVRPHATELDALNHLASQNGYLDRVQFVPFGEVLKP